MTPQQTAETGVTMTAKATPPLAVVGANLAGIPVSDWVQYVTLAYVVVMLAHKVWSWYREWKPKRRAPRK